MIESLRLQEAAINNAIGEAETISKRSQATADGLRMIAGSIAGNAGSEAVSMTVAQQYVEAFGKIAKTGAHIAACYAYDQCMLFAPSSCLLQVSLKDSLRLHCSSSTHC